MEQRQHPRVQIPLVVELSHASIGAVETTARDISDGGVFVFLTDHKLPSGATLKVKLKSAHTAENSPTPTVDMQVARIESDGVALSFKNKTAAHLWSSVERLRDELKIGRDYFQVFQSLFIQNAENAVLIVQQHGRWQLPGHYLTVDQSPDEQLESYCQAALGLRVNPPFQVMHHRAAIHPALPETATFAVVVNANTADAKPSIGKDSPLRDWRWVSKMSEVNDLTVDSQITRDLLRDACEAHT